MDFDKIIITLIKYKCVITEIAFFYFFHQTTSYQFIYDNKILVFFFYRLQKALPAFSSFVRNISGDKSLKEILAEKIPQEQENVKAFRKSHGSTKVGEVTVDMVRIDKFQKFKNLIDRIFNDRSFDSAKRSHLTKC